MPDLFDPPKQQRSRETYERILRAADELFRDRSPEATSVREVVRRAGCTEGSFYARFSSKEGFLRHVERRVLEEQRAVVDRFAGEPWSESALDASSRELIRAVIRLYERRKGLLRGLIIRSRSDAELRERLQAFIDESLDRLAEAIGAALPERVAERDERVRFGMLMVRSTLREAILFDEFRGPDEGREEALAEELGRAFVGYLLGQPDR